jgi:hypothetical protein
MLAASRYVVVDIGRGIKLRAWNTNCLSKTSYKPLLYHPLTPRVHVSIIGMALFWGMPFNVPGIGTSIQQVPIL